MTTPTPEMFTKLRKLVPAFSARVAPVYKMLNWRWQLERARSKEIPNARDIAGLALRLIHQVEAEELEGVESGGLGVKADEHGIHLSFETSVSVFYGEE